MPSGSSKRKERSARGAKPERTTTRKPAETIVPPQFSRPYWLARILRERIIAGEYQPGQRVRESDLRHEFGFSNGPIREALHLIVADGLAERAPWQGVRVISLNEKQIVELFQVRLALLEYAAELAATHCSKDMIAEATTLKETLSREFSKAKSEAGRPLLHGLLSKWLFDATGNETLKTVWEKIMLQSLIYVNASFQRAHGSKIVKLVDDLIEAVTARDVVEARNAARALTRQTLADLGIKEAI